MRRHQHDYMRRSAVTNAVHKLASTRLALLGMALFGGALLLTYNNPQSSLWLMVAPLVLLAVNLLAAVVFNPRINRQSGLLILHLALLGIILLAAVGRLTRFDGRVEITEGSLFSPGDVEITGKGPLHPGRLDQVIFAQGSFSVDYEAGLSRAHTRSHVIMLDDAGRQTPAVVGDQVPLALAGYLFYTTSNKGFAPLLTWIPDEGQPASGTVNMPTYPYFDWNQSNRWTPPGGEETRFHLQIEQPLNRESAWTLDSKHIPAALEIESGERRAVLHAGESVRLAHGVLRFDELRGWMGYKVFFDPTLPWMFWTAVTGVVGMAWHFWCKLSAGRQGYGVQGAENI